MEEIDLPSEGIKRPWLRSYYYPLTDSDGDLKNVVLVHEDVTEPKEHEKERQELVERLGRHARELEQRVADRTRELSVLYDIAAVASESVGLETTLQRVLAHALAALEDSAGTIRLLDEEGEVLHLAAHQDLPPEIVAQAEARRLGEGLAGHVLDHGGPLTALMTDPRVLTDLTAWGFDHYAGVPIRAAGRRLGVLSVVRKKEQPEFSEDEVALLASIADQVGTVVESAQLRQLAEQAAVLEERARLARELHDSVTQALYSVTLLAETGRKAAAAGDLAVVERCLTPLGGTVQQALWRRWRPGRASSAACWSRVSLISLPPRRRISTASLWRR
jgi:nitrate/nitrite-specific signal transduction histidine kinase